VLPGHDGDMVDADVLFEKKPPKTMTPQTRKARHGQGL